MRTFWKLLCDTKAATAIEYGMIVAFIAVAAMGAIISFGSRANTMWNTVSQNVSNNM
ncbi:MAG TPA: Flp family type IVb pilin [Allosphingosinicella sp.]|jgi:pilus assembly protein Flp/PilA